VAGWVDGWGEAVVWLLWLLLLVDAGCARLVFWWYWGERVGLSGGGEEGEEGEFG
jgi:hypothetical protein